MKEKNKKAHMEVAYVYARLSYCKRRQVGCVLVKSENDNPIAIGYNGTPPGEENVCEENGVTKPNVIHAEDNALRKLDNISDAEGTYVFVTTAPCIQCAEKLKNAKVKKVYYVEKYKCAKGLAYLEEHNIETEQIKITTE